MSHKPKSGVDLTDLWDPPVEQALRWVKGTNIRSMNLSSTPGYLGTKDQALAAIQRLAPEMAEMQEKLFANGKSGGTESLLLVIQGLDTAGKGGIIKHVIGLVDPQGVKLSSFGVPTAEESEHDYLWRIEKGLPKPGYIGVFDRSQFEQVLVVRTDELEDEKTWRAHYGELNDFDTKLISSGTKVIKVALIVSRDEQKRRLLARLDHPNKYWKFSMNDLKTRAKFSEYLDAYQEMLDETSTVIAPWYVIPADNKWYVHLAITQLLVDALKEMHLSWPQANFNVEEQKQLLASS